MTDSERLSRLTTCLEGSGVTVQGPYGVWGLNCSITDAQLNDLAEWADLEYLVVRGCPVTNLGLRSIACFSRLHTLDIGGTHITGEGIANGVLPGSIRVLGCSNIFISDEAAAAISTLKELEMLNCNFCGLTLPVLQRLMISPKILMIEAVGSHVPDAHLEQLSLLTSRVQIRTADGVWKDGELI